MYVTHSQKIGINVTTQTELECRCSIMEVAIVAVYPAYGLYGLYRIDCYYTKSEGTCRLSIPCSMQYTMTARAGSM